MLGVIFWNRPWNRSTAARAASAAEVLVGIYAALAQRHLNANGLAVAVAVPGLVFYPPKAVGSTSQTFLVGRVFVFSIVFSVVRC